MGLVLALLAMSGSAGRAESDGTLLNDEQIEVRVVALAAGKPDFAHVRGTAFLVGPRGLLVTAAHAVVGKDGEVLTDLFILRPTPPTTTASPVKVVRQFPKGRDLALLQMDRKPKDPDLPFFQVGADVRTGQNIVMAGYPLVFDRVYRWPLFRFGRVSSVRYFLRENKVLVLDLVSASGFSGAPVIRVSDGAVVGVQKGGATGNPDAGFSVATEISPEDLMVPASQQAEPELMEVR